MKFIVDFWLDEEFESEEAEEKALKEYIFDALNFSASSVTITKYKEGEMK